MEMQTAHVERYKLNGALSRTAKKTEFLSAEAVRKAKKENDGETENTDWNSIVCFIGNLEPDSKGCYPDWSSTSAGITSTNSNTGRKRW
jgi:hypothetical protein